MDVPAIWQRVLEGGSSTESSSTEDPNLPSPVSEFEYITESDDLEEPCIHDKDNNQDLWPTSEFETKLNYGEDGMLTSVQVKGAEVSSEQLATVAGFIQKLCSTPVKEGLNAFICPSSHYMSEHERLSGMFMGIMYIEEFHPEAQFHAEDEATNRAHWDSAVTDLLYRLQFPQGRRPASSTEL